MKLSKEIQEFVAMAEERTACEEAIKLVKKIGLRNLFVTRYDYQVWALVNIPIHEWPNAAVQALAEANPVRVGLMLSNKAPGLVAPFAGLDYLDLSGADLRGANFNHSLMNCINFRNAKLQKCYFANCSLQDADFTGADLSGANFCGASLVGANFNGADLTEAKFGEADIVNADFTGAHLLDTELPDEYYDGSYQRIE